MTTTTSTEEKKDLGGLYAATALCATIGPTLLTYHDRGPLALLGVIFVGGAVITAANIAYEKVLQGLKSYKESRGIDAIIEKLTDRITDKSVSNGDRLSAFLKLSTAVGNSFETKSPSTRQEVAQGMTILGKSLTDDMPPDLQTNASDVVRVALSEINWKLGTLDTHVTPAVPSIATLDKTDTDAAPSM